MSTSIMKNRRIDPGVCANDVLAELGPWAQLLFERMPMIADRDGLLKDRPKRIRALIFPHNDGDTNVKLDIDKLLEELEEAGFIMRYEVEEVKVICIINFGKHQPVHSGEKASILPRPPNWPIGKGNRGKDSVDPAHGIKCEFIIDEVKKTLGKDCSHSKAAKILQMAGGASEIYSFAYSLIAIRRAKKWIKTDQFVGAVRKELRERGLWTDKNNEDVKTETEILYKFLEEHLGRGDGHAEKKK